LIRNVVGLDEPLQTISIGDYVRPGQTVQFHIRDAESASVELEQMLGRVAGIEPKSALLFTCNGRGLNLFSDPNHDAAAVQGRLTQAGVSDDMPVAGFFAAGEIGPVGQSNFIHGFTAIVALFG
jgi:small ligand-binding sensory domain FIST